MMEPIPPKRAVGRAVSVVLMAMLVGTLAWTGSASAAGDYTLEASHTLVNFPDRMIGAKVTFRLTSDGRTAITNILWRSYRKDCGGFGAGCKWVREYFDRVHIVIRTRVGNEYLWDRWDYNRLAVDWPNPLGDPATHKTVKGMQVIFGADDAGFHKTFAIVSR
jgi:hypothetical protein